MTKNTPTSRRKARRLVLQAIYQWQLTTAAPSEIEAQFLQDQNLNKVDVPYFLELLRGIPTAAADLDAHIHPTLDRPLDQLNPIELAILRLATYELVFRPDIPYRVVIDEALRLEKTFGAVEGFKFINAVLDVIARQIRAIEFSK